MLTVTIAVGLVVGLLRRGAGRYEAPRAVPLVLVAASLQVGSALTTGWVHGGLLVASIALAIAWLALQPRHLPTVLLTAGVFLNALVIVANGGMPVDPGALAAVGRDGVDVSEGFLYKHIAMTEGARLSWLADRIPVPMQRNVISVGDLLMATAIGLWVAGMAAGWRSAGSMHGEHGSGA